MKTITLILTLFLFCSLSFTQDVAGSKDHPMFNRMPGYDISSYQEKEFEVCNKFMDSKGQPTSAEGHFYYIKYVIKKDEKAATEAQINKNFSDAVEKIGGTVIYKNRQIATSMKLKKDDKVTWVQVRTYNKGGGYELWIIEEAAMKQDIVADAKSMYSDINSQGRVTLYGIYFDFDKAEVKPESDPTLNEISKLLSQNPALKLYIVGHTDNVGDFKYNMKLSQSRAEAVVKTLVSKYNVDKNRLTPAGVGPLAPVTSNDTDEGKAKNRRVELIKLN
ncbi:MAG: OmpA family protein [Ignavibacteria bacterium]|nr:OmpA family protein [Ignavibacteria bacterium]